MFNTAFISCWLILANSTIYASSSNLILSVFNESFVFQDTTITKKPDLRYPFQDESGNPFQKESESALYLRNPSNITRDIVYNPETNEYTIFEKIGDKNYRTPVTMSLEEFKRWEFDQEMRAYWKQRATGNAGDFMSSLIPQIRVGGEGFDKVFGSNVINIVPQGSAELIFGVNISRIDNPSLSEKLRKVTTFDFQEKIQMNVSGTIGDKVKLGVNYNTEATFDFENQTKLEYAGKEDEIIKKIEAGNINFPLSGTLITGSQSLFGLKTDLQFGKLSVSTVFSQQKGETSVIEVKGGAQIEEYEVLAVDYEANRHFFLSHYFRDNYDRALQNLPVINTGINIERIEVWVTNQSSNFEESRNIAAFLDLAESSANIYNTVPEFQQNAPGVVPYNDLNGQYQSLSTTYSGIRDINSITSTLAPLEPGFLIGQDFEKVENARKLTEREYTLNRQLGYISLSSALNADVVLAVAYEYTLNGEVFTVGELSTDGVSAPNTLIMKLLKGTSPTPKLPTWDLMMKNVYSIGAYQVEKNDFQLHVLYLDDKTGNAINYITEGNIANEILLQVMNLDNLDSQLEQNKDGMFDFMPGITINPSNGRIIFPVLEPFGSYLRAKIGDDAIADRYVFEELYDSTKVKAEQISEKNKFLLGGTFSSSSSSDISLNALNVPQGSVKVTAGGIQLTENVDYTVDYNLGRVRIINPGLLESQTPIRVSLESNQLFAIQTKTLLGTHLDYKINDKFNVGATVMNLTERPLTQKINVGEEPMSNTIWGLNTSFETNSQLLTNMVDWLPLIQTKAPSSIRFTGEFAQLIPGHSKAVGRAGTSYIDDFEGSITSIDMKSLNAWVLSSLPSGQYDLFPEAETHNNLASGYNRAKLAWYFIDPLFLRNNATTPDHIKNDPEEQSSHFVREIFEKEIWPNKESPSGIPTNIAVLNLAYYPEEKGPYNYDVEPNMYSSGIDNDGKLIDPEARWGGIMREVQTNDFEAANIQFIQFWLMDPFVEDPTHQGGELYFNLGNISEDILNDSRKSFENGLPTSPEIRDVDSTAWGRVPVKQSLVNAFDNDIESRIYQDIGLDGLRDIDEASFFEDYLDSLQNIVNPGEWNKMSQDPSSDNFHYYRGSDYDRDRVGILDRYKAYNGLDGNSPTAEQSDEPYPTTGSTLPDVEDINRDNTLSETESYFQYKVPLRPNNMNVGSNYITDIVSSTVTLANGQQSTVKWYQFKIPLSIYEKVGAIQDFRSIRFMRIFLRDFRKPVVLRFAELELVRGEWRKYDFSLMSGGERLTTPQPGGGIFEIAAVNIEENASKEPVNYVLPPGFDREIDPNNPQLQQLNEQAMVLYVEDLEDGDARAAFKNLSLDFRKYKKLRLEVHGEALTNNNLLDDELSVFIRLGTDYKDNYYEYEIPLKVTPPGRYNDDSESDRKIVWPEENQIVISLEQFLDLKQARNEAMRRAGSGISPGDKFSIYKDDRKLSISGNPTLSNVRTIMMGVRNPLQDPNDLNDDGAPKSGEIWVNELRLTDFDRESGWAANARLQAQLADFGSIDVAGLTIKPGFGSIEKKVSERSIEEVLEYDLSSNLELGKFFPEKANVHIPVYMGYSESIVSPEYNPLEPDIPLEYALENAETKTEKDSIKHFSQDYTKRKSLNFTNVNFGIRGDKPRFYDLANLSFNYSYNEIESRNVNTEIDLEKNYRGGFSYIFNTRPKNLAPFQKSNALRSQSLRLIKDINFYPYPNYFSFRTDLNRRYNEVKTRNINNPHLKIDPTFRKDFFWNRYYDVKWDLTRALKFDFTAGNIARIDEPIGGVDKERYANDYDEWRDSVMVNLRNFGRTTHYYHKFNASFTVPINKLPFLNWVTLTARYSGGYDWYVGPQFPDSVNINLGNTISNSNTAQLNGQMNFVNLYNKLGYLRKINQKSQSGKLGQQDEKRYKDVSYKREKLNLKANEPKAIYHKLLTEDVSVRVLDENDVEIKGSFKIDNERRITYTAEEDNKNLTLIVEGRKERKNNPLIMVEEVSTRVLMGIRNISVSYSQNQGTFMPGYNPKTEFMGLNDVNGEMAPGWPFILGYQDKNFPEKAIRNNWITSDTILNNAYMMTHNENFNLRSTIEPLRGIRIDLTANRRFASNYSAYYLADANGNFPDSIRNPIYSGNFSMSYVTLPTAFEKVSAKNNYGSENFDIFMEYTKVISERLARERQAIDPGYNPDIDPETGLPIEGDYKNGYDVTSQEVLVPAFLAAYARRDPEKIELNIFPSLLSILPNWRITFDGLNRSEFVKRFFRSITISHVYRSSYDIGAYRTNLNFIDGEDIRDLDYNFLPEHSIATVSLNEQFSPLINVDMVWKNGISTRMEIKKSRNLSLSLANNQLTQITNDEIVIGTGYRFDEVQFMLKTGGRQKELKSDLNLRADFSIRDNKTIMRKIVEETNEPTAGQKIFTLKFTADYVLSDRFNLRLFYDRIVNKPFVARTFPTYNTKFGFTLRFTLVQ
ncbi:MAG: cell surface protein SprA [Bacteroidota bacterium]|nr:cell surface protein SprA [Bacteroidota bacterium]